MTIIRRIGAERLLHPAGALLIPGAVFFLFLQLQLPLPLYAWLLPFRLPHFVLLIGLYFFCFRLENHGRWLAGCSLTALIFALLLARNWSLGISNANIIAGFIPYKDAFYYYNSARELLSGNLIPANGLQGLFRPLFPGLLAVLLAISGHNLLTATAWMTLLLAFSCHAAAHAIRERLGSAPASLWMALVTAFIAPLVGFQLTELPSLAYASLALVLLMRGEEQKSWLDILLGSLILVLATSIRAGAFLMLPLLAAWAAYSLRDKNIRKNLLRLTSLLLVMLIGVVLANFAFPRLVTAPGAPANGSFAWMLYGQAVGGAGWQYHTQALGTSDPEIVLGAAIQKILTYPQGLAIGALKAYRDFFSISYIGMFDLFTWGSLIPEYLFWAVCIGLALAGVVRAVRRPTEKTHLLFLAAFTGVLVSIPFLPPADGGKRFYAGAVPFIFGIMCLGVASITAHFLDEPQHNTTQRAPKMSAYRLAGIVLLSVNLIGPSLLLATRRPQAPELPDCPSGQVPYSVDLHPGAFVDILPDANPTCGRAPALCLSQFQRWGLEKRVDDFYQELEKLAEASPEGIRLAAVNDLATQEFYFFAQPIEPDPEPQPGKVLSGCAQTIHTQFQIIRLAPSARQIN